MTYGIHGSDRQDEGQHRLNLATKAWLVDKRAILNADGTATALGYEILSLLPRFSWKIVPAASRAGARVSLVILLLGADPPDIERAIRVIHTSVPFAQDRPADVRLYIRLLYAVDPPRACDLVQDLVNPLHAQWENERTAAALEAMLAADFESGVATALSVLDLPLDRNGPALRRCAALRALTAAAPIKYRAVLERSARSSNLALATCALDLIAATPRWEIPALKRCIEAHPRATELALERLLRLPLPWTEHEAYMLSLLAHRSKTVRDVAAHALMMRGMLPLARIESLLLHPHADVRRDAVTLLEHIGDDAARQLLQVRLEHEHSHVVRRALADALSRTAHIPAATCSPTEAIAAIEGEAKMVFAAVSRPVIPWLDRRNLPTLRWITRDPIPEMALDYLLYCQLSIPLADGEIEVRASRMLAYVDRDASHDFARTVFNRWWNVRYDSIASRLLPLICALADGTIAGRLREAIEYRDAWLSVRATRCLALVDSDVALSVLNDLAHRIPFHHYSRGVESAARMGLAQAIERRGLSRDEADLRALSRPDLDEHGEHVFCTGDQPEDRQYIVRLGEDLYWYLFDSTGKPLRQFPRAKVPRSTWREYRGLKRQGDSVLQHSSWRLKEAMTQQREWSVAAWEEIFLHHPVLRLVATNLVWALVNEQAPHTYRMVFRPLVDGASITVDGTRVYLPTEGRIVLADPRNLSSDMLNAWVERASRDGLHQPFAQLSGPRVPSVPVHDTVR